MGMEPMGGYESAKAGKPSAGYPPVTSLHYADKIRLTFAPHSALEAFNQEYVHCENDEKWNGVERNDYFLRMTYKSQKDDYDLEVGTNEKRRGVCKELNQLKWKGPSRNRTMEC